ncbi:hypothetical protein MSG28_009802 [Choristoneura fumiferana]|uniref:Uncharacterized protein n=1 Tax=Choristoneura fumiferana TaxID=7141 RepID=A0ACC0JCN5_CHOFU|nr:hypothetical protein MSG28_009802 [Choristoneura fumiferana]
MNLQGPSIQNPATLPELLGATFKRQQRALWCQKYRIVFAKKNCNPSLKYKRQKNIEIQFNMALSLIQPLTFLFIHPTKYLYTVQGSAQENCGEFCVHVLLHA